MSDTKNQLTNEQVQRVGGGESCTAEQAITIIENLTGAYESLVGFTSHVIERVSNGLN